MSALQRLARMLPPRFVRLLGRLQFRVPLLRRLFARLNAQLTEGEGVIAHGAGAGLRFDASGGQPGYLLGTTEPAEQQLLAAHLRPGAVFYDIGANVGFFSTIAARLVAPDGSVWAFEPFPPSAQRARANAELNGFGDRVHVVEAAVGSRRTRMTLALHGGSAQHRLSEDAAVGIEVDVVAIDEWRRGCGAPAPTLVMIDAEGAELEVLEGMLETLREHRPLVVCEVHWLGSAFLEFVRERLEPLGYGLAPLDGDVPAGSERWHALLTPAPVAVSA